jgi:hypothetical protein
MRFADAKSLEKAMAECPCAMDWNDERAKNWWNECSDGSGKSKISDLPTRTYPKVTPNDI